MSRIVVDIPMEHYNNLLQRCDAKQPAFETLKNGIINRVKDPQAVEILCPIEEARSLLEFATKIDPEAAVHVAQSIDAGRELSAPARSHAHGIEQHR